MYSETFARYCNTAGPSYTYTANYCVVAYVNCKETSCNHYYSYYGDYYNTECYDYEHERYSKYDKYVEYGDTCG